MGRPGPKRLSSSQLRQRGSSPRLIRARAQEEAQARARMTILPGLPKEIVIPESLTAPACRTLYDHIAKNYRLEPIGESVLVEALLSKQRADACRETIDLEGSILYDKKGHAQAHPLLAPERNMRALSVRLLSRLGLLE